MSTERGTRTASRGSIGGSSGDAGVEYRRAVAAYAVAYGLAGSELRGFGVEPANATVGSVCLETDDPVDDIRIGFTSGWTSYVQAKRRLTKGRPFDKAVEQWVKAAKDGLDPRLDRLVLVAGSLSGPLVVLQRALDRCKTDAPAEFTQVEYAELNYLDERLTALNEKQRSLVHRCAVIQRLEVEEEHYAGVREAAILLREVVSSENRIDPWKELLRIAGQTARRRGGFEIDGWFDELRKSGVTIRLDGNTRAADLERHRRAVGRYLDALRHQGSQINLSGLGARFAPLKIEDVDAEVEVQIDETDSRSGSALVWAYLRRGRFVLTGLPGGGKSTSLAILADQLSRLSDAPMPILVSLKRIGSQDRTLGFRHRLLNDATRDLGEADQLIVRSTIEDRLANGNATLILDSLDETYERRGDVVEEIGNFIASISQDLDVVLATRDVAYGQAEALGWQSLRLMPPKEIDRTIETILRSEAERRFASAEGLGDETVDHWVGERKKWIDVSLTADATLRETPLLPILLSLLASERSRSVLPKGRASILAAVVEDVVKRRESRRVNEFVLGSLRGADAAAAALDAFAIEGRLLMTHGGQAPLVSAIDSVAAQLGPKWGLSVGHRHTTAQAVVRFWDESGIFVITGATEMVSARLTLFAEIGDAIAATKDSDTQQKVWIRQRNIARSIEPLVLAAGLSQLAADELGVMASETPDRQLLLAIGRAIAEGASLSPGPLQGVIDGLTDDVRGGGREGWESWLELMRFPGGLLPEERMFDILNVFPEEFQVTGRALVALKFQSATKLCASPEPLLDVLGISWAPKLDRRSDDASPSLDVSVNLSLMEAKFGAADMLLGKVPRATDLVVQSLDHVSVGMHQRLIELLGERGFEAEAEEALRPSREAVIDMARVWSRFDIRAHRTLLEMISAKPSRELDFQERNRLDELANFVETLDFNSLSSWPEAEDMQEYEQFLNLVGTLGSFDMEVTSGQAAIALRRLDELGDEHAGFFALFDQAQSQPLTNWSQVVDHAAAVELLVPMFRWRLGSAKLAATALWASPVAEFAAPRIRELIPTLSSNSEHQRIAALTLCSLVDGPEPESWVDAKSPILRSVAASYCDGAAQGRLSDPMLRLLVDTDGNVRETAIRRLNDLAVSDRHDALVRAASASDPGWTCLSCGNVNHAGQTSCSREKCHRVGPAPSKVAGAALSGSIEKQRVVFNVDG